MRLRILSDLHLEFGGFEPPPANADIVVLAGDIGVGLSGLEWAARAFPSVPCVYIAGNHEYYGHSVPKLTDRLRDRAHSLGIHFLENSAVDIGGVRFLGTTLWTDFALLGDRPRALATAGQLLNDYRRVRVEPAYRRLRPEDTRGWHDNAKRWLAASTPAELPTVIVSHHAPTREAIAPHYRNDPLSAAFASDLDDLIASAQPLLWIYGHTHRSSSLTVAGTRVVSNQRGYPNESGTGFDASLVVDIGFDEKAKGRA
jgi:predicted phosphohydrolase